MNPIWEGVTFPVLANSIKSLLAKNRLLLVSFKSKILNLRAMKWAFNIMQFAHLIMIILVR